MDTATDLDTRGGCLPHSGIVTYHHTAATADQVEALNRATLSNDFEYMYVEAA